MAGKCCRPDTCEFMRFHRLLTATQDDYEPWYFALKQQGKDPVKTKRGWKHPSARLTPKAAMRWMDLGFNIGIAGTDTDQLVIVDVDNEDSVPVEQIKPTLSVRSRSREGRHHYYFTNEPPAKRDYRGVPTRSAKINLPCESAGEIRSHWQYVVAPGSYVPCADETIAGMAAEQRSFAGYYTIETAKFPVNITYRELPQAYRDRLETTIRQCEEQTLPAQVVNKAPAKSGIFELTVHDVLGTLSTTRRFPCPFHGSHTGANASFDGKLLHCWRHDVTHNAITTLAVLAGVATCVDAGKAHKHSSAGPSMISERNGKQMFAIWKYAKDHGLIDTASPMPATALMWFAQANGICREEEMVNGMLRIEHYKHAKDLAREAGLLA